MRLIVGKRDKNKQNKLTSSLTTHALTHTHETLSHITTHERKSPHHSRRRSESTSPHALCTLFGTYAAPHQPPQHSQYGRRSEIRPYPEAARWTPSLKKYLASTVYSSPPLGPVPRDRSQSRRPTCTCLTRPRAIPGLSSSSRARSAIFRSSLKA